MYQRTMILCDEAGGGDGGAGGGGGGAALVLPDTIAPEYRDAVSKAGITTIDGLVKTWADTMRAQGSMIRIPGKDAGADDINRFDSRLAEAVPGLVRLPADDDAEGWKNFNTRMGVPEAPNGYKFAPNEKVPPTTAQKMDEWFANVAHKAQLPAKAAAAVRDAWLETVVASDEAARNAAKAEEDKLRGEWGAGFDQRIQMGRNFLINVCGEEGRVLAEQVFTPERLAAEPLLAKALAKASLSFGEDTVVKGAAGGVPKSLQEINAEINEVRANKAHPYHDSKDPRHQDAVAKMNSLYELKESLQRPAA